MTTLHQVDEEEESSVYLDGFTKDDSVTDQTRSTSSYTNMTNADNGEVKALVRRENRAVNGLRFIVLTVLVTAAVVCSWSVLHSFRQKEYDAFLEEYRALSVRLVDLFRNDVLQKLWIGQNLANALTVVINAKELHAPNITIPSFPALVQASIKLAPVASVKWSPLLVDEAAQRSFAAYVQAQEDDQENDPNKRTLLGEFDHMASPVWQVAPSFGEATNTRLFNLMEDPIYSQALHAVVRGRGPVLTQVYSMARDHEEEEEEEESEKEDESKDEGNRRLDSDSEDAEGGDGVERAMSMIFPVFDDYDNQDSSVLIGSVILDFAWKDYLSGYLIVDVEDGESLNYAEGIFDTDEVLIVLQNTCGQVFTLKVQDSAFVFVGEGDLHDPEFDDLVHATTYEEFNQDYASFGTGLEAIVEGERSHCAYRFLVYPTKELVEEHRNSQPLIYAFIVALIFVFTSTVFIFYDCTVARRQRIITQRAIRTNAIVASFFPEAVRNRIIEEAKAGNPNENRRLNNSTLTGKMIPTQPSPDSDPIADFFPSCTILFADIAGFTAWSSEREPTQVFKLLERTFHDFDRLAKQLGVFKVETIGDCYVAAVGIPTARSDHAVVCAKFARLIVNQMKVVCHDLEKTLGPSTAELDIRVGIHSGSCTAGVLRGEKARFQLFGDTMNTCSRMESSGLPGKVHVSGATAELLKEAGRGRWLIFREDTPELKGKGKMISYWLRNIDEDTDISSSKGSDDAGRSFLEAEKQLSVFKLGQARTPTAKLRRLVEWNVQVLSQLLQRVEASRISSKKPPKRQGTTVERDLTARSGCMLEEVEEVLALPQFDAKKSSTVDPSSIELSPEVKVQLNAFVEKLAMFYHAENPFHNFEHASHVTMSVSKLLSRIVRNCDSLAQDGEKPKTAADMHDNTFGITSDPLVQFAVVLSALIHDVDHPGVTNSVLVAEKNPIAIKYKDKSVAEQNSVDLAFALLMSPDFQALRNCIYTTDEEFHRFRNTIITLVLATDIMDKELGALRKARWAKAFSSDEKASIEEEECQYGVNRKATIVLEHLIQASDVAHTMQHWHVYKKWNEYLFQEMYEAYKAGRIEQDPSVSWYKGEVGFFDFYIIPLAKKLETCGVFGVSSHEYLQYAEQNRHEWVLKGEEMVKGYLSRVQDIEKAKKATSIVAGDKKEEAIASTFVTPAGSPPMVKYEAETWC